MYICVQASVLYLELCVFRLYYTCVYIEKIKINVNINSNIFGYKNADPLKITTCNVSSSLLPMYKAYVRTVFRAIHIYS